MALAPCDAAESPAIGMHGGCGQGQNSPLKILPLMTMQGCPALAIELQLDSKLGDPADPTTSLESLACLEESEPRAYTTSVPHQEEQQDDGEGASWKAC